MKRLFRLFGNHIKAMQIIAASLILCIGLADFAMYSKQLYTEDLIIETHELEIANADGFYSGNDSDKEHPEADTIESGEDVGIFNILEIVPTEKKGVIGYLIGGCEPFSEARGLKSGNDYIVTPQDMKWAYMDALVNPTPGAYTEHQTNADSILDHYNIAGLLKGINSKTVDSSTTPAFSFDMGNHSGYYKKVPRSKDGSSNGVYSLVSRSGNNVVMHSKFYYSSGDFDYIFLEGPPSTDPDDINVTNQKRVGYKNNDKFIVDFLGEDPEDWRKTHVASVVTRTPMNTSLADIEQADIIFINNGDQMDYYKYAARIKNLMNGSDEYDNTGDLFSSSIDFDNSDGVNGFEKVLKIYERVVVREDVAIVVEKLVCPNTTNNGFTTNMHKLMCMLFYVNKGSEPFAGRDIFTDYLKRYTTEPGKEFLNYRKEYEQYKKSDGNGGYEADKLHPDYRSISQRTTEDTTNPSYYYTHTHHWAHVGHPLVLSEDMAITGGYFNDDGILVPTYHDPNNLHPIRLERFDTFMFEDGKVDYESTKNRVKDTSIYYARRETNYWFQQNNNGPYVKMGGYNEFDSRGNWIRWVPEYYEIPADGNYRGKQRFERYANYEYYQDPNGEYVRKNGNYVIATEDDAVYTEKVIYYHDGAYESMSNTTDFVYIANDGTLVVDNKYSSDNGPYWFCIDYDGNTGNGFAFRRRIWKKEEYTTWPWDANMSVWMMKRKDETPDSYDCNMHMWYDYNAFRGDSDRYTGHINDSPFDHTYKNETLMEENGMMKGTWIKDALEGRKVKRENEDPKHVISNATKDYYISMNILNGDGYNTKSNPGHNNKTLYYNEYEVEKDLETGNITKHPDIPLLIRIKTTCPIETIEVRSEPSTESLPTYLFNYNIGDQQSSITGKQSGQPDLVLTSDTSDGTPSDKTGSNTAIYTFEGEIPKDVVAKTGFYTKRNVKMKVIMTVTLPNGTHLPVDDTITIVKRDFFKLN